MSDTQELVAELRGWCQCVRANDPCLACNAAARLEALDSLRLEALEALEPFARAAECLDAYDPDFPDDAAILRASADWFMRTHQTDAETASDLNKPLVAGDLRRAAALHAKLRGE